MCFVPEPPSFFRALSFGTSISNITGIANSRQVSTSPDLACLFNFIFPKVIQEAGQGHLRVWCHQTLPGFSAWQVGNWTKSGLPVCMAGEERSHICSSIHFPFLSAHIRDNHSPPDPSKGRNWREIRQVGFPWPPPLGNQSKQMRCKCKFQIPLVQAQERG